MLKKIRLPLKSVAVLGAILSIAGALYLSPLLCTAPAAQNAMEGTHGMRVWNGTNIQSFTHRGERVCVPSGFEALGETRSGLGWASFPAGNTGVFIKKSAFNTETFSPEKSRYRITMRFPSTTPAEQVRAYRAQLEHAASRVAELFGDRGALFRKAHTVLITTGAEEPHDLRVYPDPRADLTVMVYEPGHIRSEELLIHAFVHLYNRHDPRNDRYLNAQSPIPAGDFQELEATWAETAFRSSAEGRLERINYLYTIHRAVRENNFSLITYPPFNNRAAFEAIVPSVIVDRNASFLSAQYGHYILAPLSMVALDGLLREQGSAETVASLLSRIHQSGDENLLRLVHDELGEEGVRSFTGWITGTETVPRALIDRALGSYQ